MKKLLAIVMALVMLLPMCLIAQAEEVETKPFYLVNWSTPEGDVKYIYGMPGSWVNESKVGTGTTAENAPVSISSSNSSVQAAAQKMYDMLSKCPAGARYFNFAAQRTLFLAHCKDLVDMRHGVELTKNWITALLGAYKSMGGELDGILVDFEYHDATAYYINANYYSNTKTPNKEIYNQIAANEYYQTVLRPQLVERGFEFYNNPDPAKYPYRSELWTLENTSKEDGGVTLSRSIWNQVIQADQAKAMTEAVYEPLIQFYPNAVVSDYTTGDMATWLKSMDHQGNLSGYSTVKVGNASNANAYDYEPGRNFYGFSSEANRSKRTKYVKPASHNDAIFGDDPYIRSLWDVNNFKRLVAANPDGKVNAWITFYNYGTTGTGYSRTPYYTEVLYHIGMTNPEPFIGYILKDEVISKGYYDPDPNMCEYDYNLKIVDDIMAELTRVAGASDRKAIVTPVTWNEGFFYSGIYAGGRNVWRLTPDTDKVSVKDFKIKDSAPTFRVGDVTITFPQGCIITDGSVTCAGSCGYWIETPADVTPVVTSSASRYKNDPSFYDGFDYAAGAFTSDSVLPDTFWTVSGSAAIGKGEGLSWLELSGNASVTNTKAPQLITAGDYYAKQQCWEIEVHLAPSLGDYGDITLLSAGNGDGGVKISGGKVYYDEAGTYKEIKGVTLGDGFYLVKRDMDFRTEGAYTCCYTIWDNVADQAIAIIDNVPIAIQNIPVTNITISVSGASHKVTFDDYKLYPTGITANLDLYDAKLGRALADPAAAQTQDIGYRLSWMNASSQYKVARIYDVKTGTTVQTVEMTLGMDGIVTGIAPGSAENPVQLAVEIVDKADLDPETPPPTEGAGQGSTPGTPPPTEDPGQGSTPGTENPADGNTSDVSTVGGADGPYNVVLHLKSGGKNLVLILAISLAVVAAGAIVFFFVIKPKKTAKKPKETTEE